MIFEIEDVWLLIAYVLIRISVISPALLVDLNRTSEKQVYTSQ